MWKIINKILEIILNIFAIIFQYTIGWLIYELFYLCYIIKDFYEDNIKKLPEKILIKSTKLFIKERLDNYPILKDYKIKYFYIPFKNNYVTILISITENEYLIDKLCGCSIDNAIWNLTNQFNNIYFDNIKGIKFKIKYI